MMEIRANLMDRMIGAVAPERALRRVAARASLAAATALGSGSPLGSDQGIVDRGSYNAAKSDRRQTRGWFAKARSPNADLGKGRETLIARSRWAAMNMPMATAAIERPVAFAVGTGLMAIPDIVAESVGQSEETVAKIAARIAADYDEYMASTDPDAERTTTGYGLQEIILRAVLEAGDILQLRVMPENQPGRVSTTAWKLVEADRIVSPCNHREGEVIKEGAGLGRTCVFGVEMDEYAAPVAFHALRAPRDAAFNAARRSEDTVRIPAWGEKNGLPSAMLLMAKRRAEQARGVPLLAPVLELLRQLSDLTEAEAFAAVMTAMLAIVYKSPGATAFPEPVYEQAGVVTSDAPAVAEPRSEYRMEAGSVLEIDSDAEVDVKSPGRPNPAFDPFFQAIVRQIAAATETPFEVLQLHFTASYSASRGALEVFYLTIRRRREWLASMSEAPRYQAWLFEQVARGRYRLPGFLNDVAKRAAWSRVRFRGDGKISLDPAREARGFEIQESHGWRTGTEITAELTGGDFDSNIKRRALEHQAFVDAKLPIPNQNGGGTAPASDDERSKGNE